mmetsp:Transcript_30191/g.101786  ORF Transcript_30191/g.101786 Transcript_30191/m.101786 type:complete len:282 (-) Transcript_30191:1119-1964(-)
MRTAEPCTRSARIETRAPSALQRMLRIAWPACFSAGAAAERAPKAGAASAAEAASAQRSNLPGDPSCLGSRRSTWKILIRPLVVATARKRPLTSRCVGVPSPSEKEIFCRTTPCRLQSSTQADSGAARSSVSSRSCSTRAGDAKSQTRSGSSSRISSVHLYTWHSWPLATTTWREETAMARMEMRVRSSAEQPFCRSRRTASVESWIAPTSPLKSRCSTVSERSERAPSGAAAATRPWPGPQASTSTADAPPHADVGGIASQSAAEVCTSLSCPSLPSAPV